MDIFTDNAISTFRGVGGGCFDFNVSKKLYSLTNFTFVTFFSLNQV